MKKILIGLVLLLTLLPTLTSATTYYVSTSGSDSNPGTQAAPWKTIQKAANTMVAGDTVYILAGVYKEKVNIPKSGEPEKYITFSNYGTDEVIIDAENGVRDFCIDINGKSYLKFIGLKLVNAGPTGWRAGLRAIDNSSNIIMDSLTVQNCRFGLLIYGKDSPVSNITLRNSVIAQNKEHGVFLYKKVYDSTIGPNNHVYGNGEGVRELIHGIEIGTDYPGLQSNGAQRITVFDNEVNNNGCQGIRTWNAKDILIKNNYCHHNGATGIQIEDGSENIIVDSNRCEHNAQTFDYETGVWIARTVNSIAQNNMLRGNVLGLMVTTSNNTIIRNNIIYDNNRGVGYNGTPNAINAMGIHIDAESNNVIAVHNTLFKNGQNSQRAGITFCGFHPPSNGIVVKNNIVSEALASLDIWMSCDSYTSDYNDYFNTRALSVYWKGSTMNWNSYLAASGQDQHTLLQDPLFADSSTGNFNLQSNSPLIDKGTVLTRTVGSGSGALVSVEDARFFSDGIGLMPGDLVKIGSNNPVRITSVDLNANTITLEQSIAWSNGDAVTYPYSGAAPDIGAHEYKGSSPPPSCATADINCDTKVDISDLNIVASDFGKSTGFNNQKSDTNNDGIIDIYDVVYVASRIT